MGWARVIQYLFYLSRDFVSSPTFPVVDQRREVQEKIVYNIPAGTASGRGCTETARLPSIVSDFSVSHIGKVEVPGCYESEAIVH